MNNDNAVRSGIPQWNILQAMHRLCLSWNSISPTAIANCFTKAGFPPRNTTAAAVTEDDIEQCEAQWAQITVLDEPDVENEEEPELTRPGGSEVCSELSVLESLYMTCNGLSHHMPTLQ
ncbi:hypothetical protein PR048_020351 [Dryococelus australis]|uniref:DDE-1 domain-containing protein n=1 Tax=Dryococelus australis TaxID=614101 RepID=A0ABQ9H6F7_9NEOP|nr:hypothetical protein PR048_020351 [Dryococelus australis]